MERPYFSEMLSERRRELGYSIRQASRVLRLREDVLVAFEEGDFEQMPKSGYAQGMLSSYARYLGLDANVVVEAYANDYEAYKRENRRRGGTRSNGSRSTGRRGTSQVSGTAQPYVGSRGLLPTSGGLAGDMGSFATTRVHTRASSSYEDADANDGMEDAQGRMEERPYTRTVPSSARRAYRQPNGRASRDIETMSVDGYNDDLRLGRDARPYEAASTRSGRRSSRNIASSQRPRVRAGQGQANRGRRGDRGRSRGARRGSPIAAMAPHASLIIAFVAVLAISLIIVLSVGSCVRQGTSSSKTVPVSAASASSSSASSSNAKGSSSKKESTSSSSSSSSSNSGANASSSSSSSTSASNKETSVSVSVADGAVTWLEVECDGKSDVAETVTGPWQKTYTVEESLSVQAGDTSSVSVVQDGKQVQFESMASGIGSIRIQGTKKKGTSSSSSSSKNDSSGSEGTSAKTGNATSKGDQEGQKGGGNATATGQSGANQTGQGQGNQSASNANGEYGYGYEYGSNSGYGTESEYEYENGY